MYPPKILIGHIIKYAHTTTEADIIRCVVETTAAISIYRLINLQVILTVYLLCVTCYLFA